MRLSAKMLLKRNTRREYSTKKVNVVKYFENGYPARVLKVEQDSLGSLGADDVHFQMKYAPINVDDINVISGRYGVRQQVPAVGGNEGLGVVVAVGSGVKEFGVGDMVVPNNFGVGTWREEGIVGKDQLFKVTKNGVREEQLATLTGPLTAFRLLNDFVELKKGDVIALNGASTPTGQAIIQLAKSRGIKTICVVRNECYQNTETVKYLNDIGATVIVDEISVSHKTFSLQIADLGCPKLSLDVVGGNSSTNMSRLLGDFGTLVVYGGISPAPVILSTSSIIFKDISVRGFFLTRWFSETSPEEKAKTFLNIMKLVKEGVFTVRQEQIPFSKFETALEKSLTFSTSKIVIKM